MKLIKNAGHCGNDKIYHNADYIFKFLHSKYLTSIQANNDCITVYFIHNDSSLKLDIKEEYMSFYLKIGKKVRNYDNIEIYKNLNVQKLACLLSVI